MCLPTAQHANTHCATQPSSCLVYTLDYVQRNLQHSIGDVYDNAGNVHSSFVLSAAATKGARTRTVYVNKTLKRQLAQYYPTLPKQPTAPLFCSQKGSFFSANTMCQLLIHIFQQCSLKHATSHSGRRTFITRLASKGVGVRVLAELAGHSSIATTQRYIDVNAEQLANAVELV